MRLFAIAVMGLFACSVQAQKLVVDNVTVEAEASTAEMVIALQDNTTEVANWQLFITLPDGFKFTKKKVALTPSLYPLDEDDEPMHTIDLSNEGQVYKLLVYCNPTTPLKSTNGVLATITLTAPEGFTGVKDAKVSNIHLSTVNSVDIAVDDADFKIADAESAGIAEIETMRNAGNEKFYNLAGQKVSDSFKGLVIKGGKKFVK